jgi:hypothetical protein
VKRWLDHCKENHNCGKVIEALPFTEGPSRLVALGSKTTHLEETGNILLGDYVALSYCWGEHEPKWRTTRQNLQCYLEHIQDGILPQTIKDAIHITRELGYKYLWVDALCIVQEGNENDKRNELRKMASIYCGASVVLSAARAGHSEEGFLHERKLGEIYGAVFELRAQVEGAGTHAFFLHDCSTDDSEDEVIDKRAWTLQEHSLAIRLLRFGSKQTRWKCLQGSPKIDGGCDCHKTTIDPIAFTGGLSERLLKGQIEIPDSWKHDNWVQVVHEYSSREMSRISDKLPALAALAQMFAVEGRMDPRSYCAGLWRDDLPMQLLWRRVNLEYYAEDKSLENSNPSWSWASTRGRIEHFPNRPVDRERSTLENIECCINLNDPSLPYGEVQSAKLIVDGYLREVNWDGHVLYLPSFDARERAHCNLALGLVFDQSAQISTGIFWLLHVHSSPHHNRAYGLILEMIRDNRDFFKRVGYFEANLNPQEQDGSLDIPLTIRGYSSGDDWLRIYGKRRITIL